MPLKKMIKSQRKRAREERNREKPQNSKKTIKMVIST